MSSVLRSEVAPLGLARTIFIVKHNAFETCVPFYEIKLLLYVWRGPFSRQNTMQGNRAFHFANKVPTLGLTRSCFRVKHNAFESCVPVYEVKLLI